MSDAPEWEPTLQKCIVDLRKTMVELHEVWEDIGFTQEVRSAYCEQAYTHISDLLKDMISESQTKKDALLRNVKQLMEQIPVLCEELGTHVATNGYEHLTLKEVEQVLCADLQKLQQCKEQRMASLKELLAKQQSICNALGTKPISMDHLPSEQQIKDFKMYLEKQEVEKDRLEAIYNETRRAVVKMMDDIGRIPTLNFECLVYNNTENFVMSPENMNKLRELRDQFKRQVEEAKQLVNEMKTELIALWKFLNEPEHVWKSFLDSCVGYNNATIDALRAEIKRCKEKRKQNISKYISQARAELEKLWDLCKYSENQRKEFSHFNSLTYTEDLLTLHELELERVQKFYITNQPIFALLEERENLWKKMRELRQRANNPDRFYNRGGQLLTEEKERKTIQKKLPKIEDQLRNLIKEYESRTSETFTANGVPIEEFLKESWDNFHEEKETLKIARKEAKDKPVKLTPSSLKKGPGLLTARRHTPLSSKRKLFSSPNSSAKRRNVSTSSIGSKTRRSGKVSRKLIQSASKAVRNGRKKNNSSQTSAGADSTYSQFKEHLEERRELRSSLLPEQVLINATKSKMKTPVRTPVKPLRKNVPILVVSSATPKSAQSRSIKKTPLSPRIIQSARLATTSTQLPIIF